MDLLMLQNFPANTSAGNPGQAGSPGRGGAGGPGGRGGSSHTYTTSSTDSQGKSTSTSHTVPGGSDGPSGASGRDGQRGRDGVSGRDAVFTNTVDGQQYPWRYVAHVRNNPYQFVDTTTMDDVWEPFEQASLTYTVTNVGPMPTPAVQNLVCSVHENNWIKNTTKVPVVDKYVPTGQQTALQQPICFELADAPEPAPNVIFRDSTEAHWAVAVERVNKYFTAAELGAPHTITIEHPIRASRLHGAATIARTEVAPLVVCAHNVSRIKAWGSGEGRVVRVSLCIVTDENTMAPSVNDGVACIVDNNDNVLPYVDVPIARILPNQNLVPSCFVKFSPAAAEYSKVTVGVQLFVGHVRNFMCERRIQRMSRTVQLAEYYTARPGATMCFVTNHSTSMEAFNAWCNFAGQTGRKHVVYNATIHDGISLEQKFGGSSLARDVRGGTIIISNEDPGFLSSVSTERSLKKEHAFDTVSAREVSSAMREHQIGICVVGKFPNPRHKLMPVDTQTTPIPELARAGKLGRLKKYIAGCFPSGDNDWIARITNIAGRPLSRNMEREAEEKKQMAEVAKQQRQHAKAAAAAASAPSAAAAAAGYQSTDGSAAPAAVAYYAPPVADAYVMQQASMASNSSPSAARLSIARAEGDAELSSQAPAKSAAPLPVNPPSVSNAEVLTVLHNLSPAAAESSADVAPPLPVAQVDQQQPLPESPPAVSDPPEAEPAPKEPQSPSGSPAADPTAVPAPPVPANSTSRLAPAAVVEHLGYGVVNYPAVHEQLCKRGYDSALAWQLLYGSALCNGGGEEVSNENIDRPSEWKEVLLRFLNWHFPVDSAVVDAVLADVKDDINKKSALMAELEQRFGLAPVFSNCFEYVSSRVAPAELRAGEKAARKVLAPAADNLYDRVAEAMPRWRFCIVYMLAPHVTAPAARLASFTLKSFPGITFAPLKGDGIIPPSMCVGRLFVRRSVNRNASAALQHIPLPAGSGKVDAQFIASRQVLYGSLKATPLWRRLEMMADDTQINSMPDMFGALVASVLSDLAEEQVALRRHNFSWPIKQSEVICHASLLCCFAVAAVDVASLQSASSAAFRTVAAKVTLLANKMVGWEDKIMICRRGRFLTDATLAVLAPVLSKLPEASNTEPSRTELEQLTPSQLVGLYTSGRWFDPSLVRGMSNWELEARVVSSTVMDEIRAREEPPVILVGKNELNSARERAGMLHKLGGDFNADGEVDAQTTRTAQAARTLWLRCPLRHEVGVVPLAELQQLARSGVVCGCGICGDQVIFDPAAITASGWPAGYVISPPRRCSSCPGGGWWVCALCQLLATQKQWCPQIEGADAAQV